MSISVKRLVGRVAFSGMIIGATLVAGASVAPGARAASHKADPPCSINPSPAALNQTFTISASGLPTVDPVWLISSPPSGSSSVSEVYVNADGTWTGTASGNLRGTWTYSFSGMLSNNKYGTVASCSVQVS